jgi:hypothetical protein
MGGVVGPGTLNFVDEAPDLFDFVRAGHDRVPGEDILRQSDVSTHGERRAVGCRNQTNLVGGHSDGLEISTVRMRGTSDVAFSALVARCGEGFMLSIRKSAHVGSGLEAVL